MSIRRLANDLGLSISTVSRALNGYTDVSDATRQRVMARAKAMNYEPHPGARSLKTGKSFAIGVILPADSFGGSFVDPMYAALLGGIDETLVPAGYSLVVSSGRAGPMAQELARYEQFLRARWFDAYVLVRTRLRDPRVDLLLEHGVPFVTYGRTLDSDRHNWVDTDNERAFWVSTQRQIDFGHRRIALLNGSDEYTFANLREKGYWQAMQQAGLRADAHRVGREGLTEKAGYDLASKLLTMPEPPTSLLCATDAMAIGAMAACRERGLRVGAQVSVVGYGNSDAGRYSTPALTTIGHQVTENGRHIGEVLLKVLKEGSHERLHYLERVELLARDSDGPLQAV